MNLPYFIARPLWQSGKVGSYKRIIAQAGQLEAQLLERSDKQLQDQLVDLRQSAQGLASVRCLLPRALALGREISRRAMGMRHYDVQLLGTLALFDGHIAEMDTGEGKTLMAPLAAFLHQLENASGCTHIVTANEYLAQRDHDWMKPYLNALGLSVGVIVPGQRPAQRIDAYKKNVVYATAREIVFDALRVPMQQNQRSAVDAILRPPGQAELNPTYDFAIVDEVDSVLIDQARSPVSIGGAGSISSQLELYKKAHEISGRLVRGEHYRLMQDERSIELKEEGKAQARREAGDVLRLLPTGYRWERYVTCALAARHIYKPDTHYVIHNNTVVLIDESTGRMMPGRQLPDGIHQAIEVANKIAPSAELRGNRVTTFQTFFRKYDKLAGMTGSASIAWYEFLKVYDLEIVPIPPHRPRRRRDHPDVVYRTPKRKFQAIVSEIESIHATGRPLLIATGSVAVSERLSALLSEHGHEHEILNAKNHAREAEIIAQAGQSGKITIITSMAGRGVDIKLGSGVAQKGGLYFLGTDRSTIRRLDQQLVGRVGRQGDPGDCRFILSLGDDILENADRKKKHRIRRSTRTLRDQPIPNHGAAELFSQVQRHNDKVARKQRNLVFLGEKQKEKLRSQGLWEDWMDNR